MGVVHEVESGKHVHTQVDGKTEKEHEGNLYQDFAPFQVKVLPPHHRNFDEDKDHVLDKGKFTQCKRGEDADNVRQAGDRRGSQQGFCNQNHAQCVDKLGNHQ